MSGKLIDELDAATLPLTGAELGPVQIPGQPAKRATVDDIAARAVASGSASPLVHGHVIGDVSGLTAALAGKADTGHTHGAGDITSGTMATARLGGGTANGTTFLRGDQQWAVPPATDLTYTAATRLLESSTGADVTLPLMASGAAGLAPASGGGTTNYLRADGTWAAPGGGGGSSLDGYVANNWIAPYVGVVAAGVVTAANQLRLVKMGPLNRTITVDGLAARITTAAASQNCQLAIYASNDATGRPTGTPLISTGNLSTGSAGLVSGTGLSAATLTAGEVYWAATISSGAPAFQVLSAATVPPMARDIGSATLGNISSGAAVAAVHLLVTHTFGTFPDLTSGSFSESLTQSFGLVFLLVDTLP